jgi:hypothetical protein
MVANDDRCECSAKIRCRIAFSAAGRNGVPKYFSAFGAYTMSGLIPFRDLRFDAERPVRSRNRK